MNKDFKIYIDDKKIEYKYEVNNNIIIKLDLNNNSKLKIIYDENIFTNIKNNKELKLKRNNKMNIEYDISNLKDIIITVKPNKNYYIKTVYKYMNNFINRMELIDELNIFKDTHKEHSKEIELLIKMIDNKTLSDQILDQLNLDMEVVTRGLLMNNVLYNKLVREMTTKELMLLITYYISSPNPPKISQDIFDELVEEGIKYDSPLENVWRLAMTYDQKDFNFDKIEEYIISTKDVYYYGEYISGVYQANHNHLIELILNTKDKEYIKKILDNEFITKLLNKKYIDKLQGAL